MTDTRRHQIGPPHPRRSVLRDVMVRGVVVLIVILGVGALATSAVYQRAKEERAFVEETLPLFLTATRLFAGTITLGTLSARMVNIDTKAELLTLADRISDRSGAVAADINDLELLGLGPAQAEHVRWVHAELIGGATNLALLKSDLLTARAEGRDPAEVDDLLARRDRLIQRQEMVASEMTTLVTGLARDMETRVANHQEAAMRSGQVMVAVVAGGAAAGGLAVLALYRNVRRLMIDRLMALTAALRAWHSGHAPIFPTDRRGDEISHLSETLRDLIAIVDDRTATLTTQALTDPLTGMLNRRGFEERGLGEVARSARYGEPLTAVLGDIDHFKVVNDTHGHAVGDDALRHVAGVWHDTLRDVDVIGRMGGEEFAALLPHTDLGAALTVAERIREAVESSPLDLGNGRVLRMTISLGVALLEPGERLDSLLDRGDRALYAAKQGGRNKVKEAGAVDGSTIGQTGVSQAC